MDERCVSLCIAMPNQSVCSQLFQKPSAVNEQQLQEVLLQKIDEGFTFREEVLLLYFLHHSLLTNLDFQLSPESKGELILDYNVSGRIL